MNRHTSCTGDAAALAGAAVRELAAARLLAEEKEGPEAPAGGGPNGLLIAGWVSLHGTGRLARVAEHPLVAAAWFGELGLDRAFAGLGGMAETADYPLLLKLMIRWQDFFAGREESRDRGNITLLFADNAVRSFLGVHAYRESEWFVKERFELLLESLFYAAEIIRSAAEEPAAEAAAPARELHALEALAAGAGYRLDRFLASLTNE